MTPYFARLAQRSTADSTSAASRSFDRGGESTWTEQTAEIIAPISVSAGPAFASETPAEVLVSRSLDGYGARAAASTDVDRRSARTQPSAASSLTAISPPAAQREPGHEPALAPATHAQASTSPARSSASIVRTRDHLMLRSQPSADPVDDAISNAAPTLRNDAQYVDADRKFATAARNQDQSARFPARAAKAIQPHVLADDAADYERIGGRDQGSNTPVAKTASLTLKQPIASARRVPHEPQMPALRASKAAPSIDVHIGRVEVEIVAPAAPMRSAFVAQPTPLAGTPAPNPSPSFNPRRHYLRSG